MQKYPSNFPPKIKNIKNSIDWIKQNETKFILLLFFFFFFFLQHGVCSFVTTVSIEDANF